MSAGDADTQVSANKEENEEKSESSETVTSSVPSASQITSEMMQNPQVLAALQHRLDSMVGTPSGYIASLPKVIKNRIHALKNLQVESAKIEAKFYEEVHELERKYSASYQPLFDKVVLARCQSKHQKSAVATRCEIITGKYEPTEKECEWDSEAEEDGEMIKEESKDEVNELSEDVENKAKIDGEVDENVQGIPEFWLTIFKNVPILQDMVQEHDEPILQKLLDIRLVFSKPDEPMGFTLEFVFDENQYFTNNVLTKYYKLQSQPDENDPFSFEGPEIVSCTGCQIDWVKGKNVTVKTIKKKQKHKGRGTVRTVSKQVANDSFFNFFSPPEVPEDDADIDPDTEALLTSDFEIGHVIRDRIIPRAVLYFTGEANDEDFDEEDEEDDDDDGQFNVNASGDDSDSANDSDFDPQKEGKPKETPQECKQQ